MKTCTILKSALLGSFVLGMSAVPAYCQDPGEVPAAAPAKAKGTTVIKDDPGVEAVYKAQDATPVAAADDAETCVQKFLDGQGWIEGRNAKKNGGGYFIVYKGSSVTSCDNPATDKNFMLIREVHSKKSILYAKKEIINYINTKLSAAESLEVPDSPADQELGKRYHALEEQLKQQETDMMELLNDKTIAEAAAKEGTTLIDRVNAFLDAALKKFDKEYDSSKIAADKKAKAEKIRAEYIASKKEWESLKTQVEEMRNTPKFKSTVKAFSQMPLLGATVVYQAEGWDPNTKQYSTCSIVVWSPGLQKASRAVLMQEPTEIEPPTGAKQTLQQWMLKQNFATMVGPRQFLDEKGNQVFVGISARSCGKSPADRTKAERAANLFARQMLAFSLIADVKAWEIGSQASMEVTSGEKTTTEVVESIETKISQVLEETEFRGMGRVRSLTVVHPISNDKIFVSVYSINPEDAAAALALEKSSYATEKMVNQKQAELQGQTAGRRDAHEASKNDRGAFEKGRQAGRTEAENAGKPAVVSPAAKPAVATPPAKPVGEKKASGGVFSGDGNVNTDF